MAGTEFHNGEVAVKTLVHGEGPSGQSPGLMPRHAPPSDSEIAAMRRNFLDWIDWYERTHRDELPTQAALAARIGVRESTVSMWRRQGSTRMPDFRSLVGVAQMVGYPLDHILRHAPHW